MSTQSEPDFTELKEAVLKASHVAIASHIRPDGDAIGSALGLAHSLIAAGKSVTVLNEDGVPPPLAFLPGTGLVQQPADLAPDALRETDLAIALDTSNHSRLGDGVIAALHDAPTLANIDHHHGNEGYGDITLVAGHAPATGQLVYQFLRHAALPIPPETCSCLYAAISTDTGSFRYPATTATTYRIAADLLDGGADLAQLSKALYESYPPTRLALTKELFSTLRMDADDRIASWALSLQAAKRIGVGPSDSEGLIDTLRAIDGVEVAAHFEELDDGRIRVSARSKGKVDVSALCATFGGGGHRLASGVRMPPPLENSRQLFIDEATKYLNG